MDEDALRALDAEPLDWRWKGVPGTDGEVTVGQIGDQKWNVLDGDLLMPAMLLKGSVLDSNIAALAEFCRRTGMWFAPHGKTYMAPEIFKRQMDAGAESVRKHARPDGREICDRSPLLVSCNRQTARWVIGPPGL